PQRRAVMPKAEIVHIKRPADKSRRRSDRVRAPAPPPARPGMSRKKLIDESRRWLSLINAHKLNDYKRRKIVSETIDNFRYYYNRGFLEYRKAVTESGEYAAIEWAGKGSHFEDVTGRRINDCMGWYGLYWEGIMVAEID